MPKTERGMTMFSGYSPETVDFLWGIRLNNNREWFMAHKNDYVTYLYEPTKELGKELFSLVADKPGTLLKVSRIYRDARMHHPLPYKESLWICIRQDMAKEPEKFLKMIRKVEKSTGLKVTADETYKRPKPTDNKKLEPYFSWKGQIGCVVEEEFSPETFGPALAERVKTLFADLMPLDDYFSRFCV